MVSTLIPYSIQSTTTNVYAGSTYIIPKGYHDGTGQINALSKTISKSITVASSDTASTINMNEACSYITASSSRNDPVNIARGSSSTLSDNDYSGIYIEQVISGVYVTNYYVKGWLSPDGRTVKIKTDGKRTYTVNIIGYL